MDSLPTELSGKPPKGRRQKPKRWAQKAEASGYVWVGLLLLSVSSLLYGLSFPNHSYFTSASAPFAEKNVVGEDDYSDTEITISSLSTK